MVPEVYRRATILTSQCHAKERAERDINESPTRFIQPWHTNSSTRYPADYTDKDDEHRAVPWYRRLLPYLGAPTHSLVALRAPPLIGLKANPAIRAVVVGHRGPGVPDGLRYGKDQKPSLIHFRTPPECQQHPRSIALNHCYCNFH